jgi:hypothetical protein
MWRSELDSEKRSEVRQKTKRCYHAEIRLTGVPVYEVKLLNISTSGSCILIKEDSLLVNYLKVRRNLMVKYYLEDREKSTEVFGAEVKYITKATEGQFKGHYLVGLAILK